ncbi:MAG: M15 family metallopeptidase [Gammaproteobacteria bacterium]|jgi:D-alanyl-D-alanine dipeptidase
MEIKLNGFLTKEVNRVVDFKYGKLLPEVFDAMQNGSQICILDDSQNILPVNIYHQKNLKGTYPNIFTRCIVMERIQQVANKLAPDYGLMVFDAYRSIDTQMHLFNLVCEEISAQHLDWNSKQVEQEARKFAAHPSDKSHYIIAPHNSGGAIDVAIYNLKSKEMCLFGTEYDDASELSKTDFFEKEFDSEFGLSAFEWSGIRFNRRVLYSLMIDAGFVNYPNEWWHYDLGDCIWAKEFGTDWMFSAISDETIQSLITPQ